MKRLLRGVGRNSGRRGSLRSDAHWQSLLAGDLIPEQLHDHLRHHYAVWRQAAKRERDRDDAAEGWNKWWPHFERAAQHVSDRLVDLAQISEGSRVLDI